MIGAKLSTDEMKKELNKMIAIELQLLLGNEKGVGK
jgi:hypothetical protein